MKNRSQYSNAEHEHRESNPGSFKGVLSLAAFNEGGKVKIEPVIQTPFKGIMRLQEGTQHLLVKLIEELGNNSILPLCQLHYLKERKGAWVMTQKDEIHNKEERVFDPDQIDMFNKTIKNNNPQP